MKHRRSTIPGLRLTLHAIFLVVILTLPSSVLSHQEEGKMALLIIDIQQFYFPDGSSPLVNPEEASLNAGKILNLFREKELPIIHIRHNARSGADIHPNVAPRMGEKVISKNEANSFNGTELVDYLRENNITNLVICGMMTHMCVEATTRAAYDLGFECTVIQDACTTKDLKYGDAIVKAQDVHLSTLSTLSGTYATVIDAETWIKKFEPDQE
jgi:nicotinamidase-related amidase